MQVKNQNNDPLNNHLLAKLSKSEYAHLVPFLKLVELKPGNVLARPDTVSQYVYFPISGTVSLRCKLDHSMSADLAIIGREGMFSIVPILGGETLPYFAEVETAGFAYRLPARTLSNEIERSKSARKVMLLFVQALFVQIMQIYICARAHSLRQLLCLHLLLLHDRMDTDTFSITQQTLAHMLGVRRESISQISGNLRRLQFIEYRRGQVTILNRHGLENECMDCYGELRNQFNKLLKMM